MKKTVDHEVTITMAEIVKKFRVKGIPGADEGVPMASFTAHRAVAQGDKSAEEMPDVDHITISWRDNESGSED